MDGRSGLFLRGSCLRPKQSVRDVAFAKSWLAWKWKWKSSRLKCRSCSEVSDEEALLLTVEGWKVMYGSHIKDGKLRYLVKEGQQTADSRIKITIYQFILIDTYATMVTFLHYCDHHPLLRPSPSSYQCLLTPRSPHLFSVLLSSPLYPVDSISLILGPLIAIFDLKLFGSGLFFRSDEDFLRVGPGEVPDLSRSRPE